MAVSEAQSRSSFSNLFAFRITVNIETNLNHINYRRCIGCRQLAPKKSLWRIIRLAQTHQIKLDRGIGRSAYLCPNIDCLNQVKINNRLSRSLKARVPEDIYQNLQARLKNV